jgi:hypothetical protein
MDRVLVYDKKEPIAKYLSRIRELKVNNNKEKYTKILNFFNIWLVKYDIKLNSLMEFKKIREDIILSDKEHNKKILKTYMYELYNELELDKDYGSSDSDEMKKLKKIYKMENDIIYFIKEILKAIDYKLKSKKIKFGDKTKKLYYIVMDY